LKPSQIILLLFLPFQIIAQSKIEGKAIRILDGDTFEILVNNKTYKIRLADIDAPEKKQDFGNVAKQRLAELIFSKQVNVEYEKLDRNQRIIGTVFVNKQYINLLLVEEGLAWHFKKYSSNIQFDKAEKMARKRKLGIWSINNPTPPWSFRAEKRKK